MALQGASVEAMVGTMAMRAPLAIAASLAVSAVLPPPTPTTIRFRCCQDPRDLFGAAFAAKTLDSDCRPSSMRTADRRAYRIEHEAVDQEKGLASKASDGRRDA